MVLKSPSFRTVPIFCLGYWLSIYLAIPALNCCSRSGLEPLCMPFGKNHYF